MANIADGYPPGEETKKSEKSRAWSYMESVRG